MSGTMFLHVNYNALVPQHIKALEYCGMYRCGISVSSSSVVGMLLCQIELGEASIKAFNEML